MIKMKLTSIILPLFAALMINTLSGCSTSLVKRNADQDFPLHITSQTPAFIFPISFHGVPGNPTEIGLAVTSAAVSEHGKSVISGQQLYKLADNLSWTLGENMRQQADNNSMTMTGGAEKYTQELEEKMKILTGKLKDLGVIKNKNYTFKYVIVLHIDQASGIQVPFMKSVTAFGGILDMETHNIVSYIEKDITLADDAILAQMPVEMNKIIVKLLSSPAEV